MAIRGFTQNTHYTLHRTHRNRIIQNTQNAQIKIIPTLITEYTLHRTTDLLMQKKINQNTQNAQTLVLKKKSTNKYTESQSIC
jgi:hypothetical protein